MDSPRNDLRLEEYLARLDTQLFPMPVEARRELRHELRQHLEVLIIAHEELGSTGEEAVSAALHQFGDPVRIGRRLADEWQRRGGYGLLRRWRGCPRWVVEAVAIATLGASVSGGVSCLWMAGAAYTPLLEHLMWSGITLIVFGQGLLMLGACANGLARLLRR
jgi:hypothetical protein